MKPLKDLLVIKLHEKDSTTSSGFIIKEAWEKPQNIATVVAVGPDVTGIAVDTDVVINPYAVIDTEEKEIKIIREKDILCLL